jgi:hypothetical protein
LKYAGTHHRLVTSYRGSPRSLLHLGEHARGHFRRGHVLALRLHPGVAVLRGDDLVRHHGDIALHDLVLELAADEALDGEQGVLRVRDGLPLRGLPHHDLAILREGDDRRSRAIPFTVLDHARLAALHDRDAGVGRAEVDADDFCHDLLPQKVAKIGYKTGRWTCICGPTPAASAFPGAGT